MLIVLKIFDLPVRKYISQSWAQQTVSLKFASLLHRPMSSSSHCVKRIRKSLSQLWDILLHLNIGKIFHCPYSSLRLEKNRSTSTNSYRPIPFSVNEQTNELGINIVIIRADFRYTAWPYPSSFPVIIYESILSHVTFNFIDVRNFLFRIYSFIAHLVPTWIRVEGCQLISTFFLYILHSLRVQLHLQLYLMCCY